LSMFKFKELHNMLMMKLFACLLMQNHLMKTEDPLREISVVKEGKENKDFLSALAA